MTFSCAPALAGAQQVTEIYKCLDPQGRPLYTSDKRDTAGKKCELVSREISVVAPQGVPAKPPPKPGVASPQNFPKESATTRANAREKQREILEKELATEQDLLAKAKKELAEQESIRTGDERNYQRVLDRLKKYQENIELHEKNVQSLKRELSNLYR